MLSGMRKASKNWLGRIVTSIIMGLLIVSFGIFGIGGWLGGAGQGALARVGSRDISFETFRSAFGNELQRLSSQQGRLVTSEQAKASGIDQQVLARLMSETVLDEQAAKRGLRISEEFTVKQFADNPSFKGKTGQFDRARLTEIARQNGLSDTGLVAAQTQATIRQQLVEAVAGGVPAPKTLLNAMNRQRTEERSISYIRLTSKNLPPIGVASDEKLMAFYNERKAEFRAPEYRKLNIISANLDDYTSDMVITDDDLRLAYDDAVKSGKLGTVERRTFQQIVFNDVTDAKAVSAKIKAGSSFVSILAERNLKPDEVTLELQTKAELIDRDVAEVVFSLAKDKTSDPIAGAFGFTIVHPTLIQTGTVKPFEAVKAELAGEARTRKIKNSPEIRTKLDALHDSVEDLRSSGKSLNEVANALKLKLVTLDSVNAGGRDKNGVAVNIADPETSLRTIFAAGIGADTEVIRTRAGSYIWFEVANIEPEHDRPLDKVKTQVSAGWLADETNRQMANLASDQLKKLSDGTTMADVAKATGANIETATSLKRSASTLPDAQPGSNLLAQIFSTTINSHGQARVERGTDRVVFKVNEAYVPAIAEDATALKTLRQQLDSIYADDLVSEYVKGSQAELGVTVNQRLLSSAIGTN